MKGSKPYTQGYVAGLLGLEDEVPNEEEAQVDYEVGQQDAKFFLMEALGRLGIVEVLSDGPTEPMHPSGRSQGTVRSDRNPSHLVGRS